MRGSKPSAEEDAATAAGPVRPTPVGQPLIVLGMHRSGTSALAGALSILGADLGEPLMKPRDGENTRGYFEHLEIYDFHQRLLRQLMVTWDDLRSPRFEPGDPLFAQLRTELKGIVRRNFAGTRPWAVKDPRACRFVPLWTAALAELDCTPRYLIVCRHPDEVAASLMRRDGFSRDKSDLLWSDHMLAAEAATRDARRVFVGYAQLLESPTKELEKIAAELEVEWPADMDAASEELGEFLSGALRHHVAKGSDIPPRGRLGTIVPRLWQALEAEASDEALFDALRAELADFQAGFDPLLLEHVSQLAVHGELTRRVTELERLLREVMGGSTQDRLDEYGRWLEVHDGELKGQRDMLWALEELIGERTRWLQIQDDILHRQIARIDALEGLEPQDTESSDAE